MMVGMLNRTLAALFLSTLLTGCIAQAQPSGAPAEEPTPSPAWTADRLPCIDYDEFTPPGGPTHGYYSATKRYPGRSYEDLARVNILRCWDASDPPVCEIDKRHDSQTLIIGDTVKHTCFVMEGTSEPLATWYVTFVMPPLLPK